MTWRGSVESDFTIDGVAIHLGERRSSGLWVFKPIQPETERVDEGVASEPMLRLARKPARALYEALSSYFGGSGDARTARDDFAHERLRVDRLTEALITIATGSAGG